MIEPQHKHR